MKYNRNNGGVIGGKYTPRTHPLWSGYGTYPTTGGRGCQRNVPITGGACPLTRAGQRSASGNGCGCGNTWSNSRNNGNGCGNRCGNNQGNNGCGCNNGCGRDCEKLLQQIRAVDFALYEVVLYLDVYPTSCEALDTYHKLLDRRKALYEQYQATCGPITNMGNMSHTTWDWIEKPFPWEADAN